MFLFTIRNYIVRMKELFERFRWKCGGLEWESYFFKVIYFESGRGRILI